MLPSKWPVFIRSFLAGFDRSLTTHQVSDLLPIKGRFGILVRAVEV
jgi:hypothetical protein